MLLAYKLGERVWLRMNCEELAVTVLDRGRDDLGHVAYLVQSDDGSLFRAVSDRLRPLRDEPLVLRASRY